MGRARLLFFLFLALPVALPAHAAQARYEIGLERGWIAMPDGVRLSVTYFKPSPAGPGERFPVLLEYMPYRKDDMFYERDYELYAYFVRRGYIVAKIDIRGSGSSEGTIPEREYADQEIEDGLEAISFLAAQPWSTGSLGMFGISWSGFNAIQVAMRRPPALKAILAADAADDLFHDDVHYIDGIFHMDEYHLSVYHDAGLPATPDYAIDENFFRQRFDRPPWQSAYLRHQRDGEFWARGSLRSDYTRLTVPAYLIGGLLDGYRDSVPRMLEQAQAPVKAEIGPWNHAWPDDGEPGPNYEWRARAVRWWDRWLKGIRNGIEQEPRLVYFLRDDPPADARLKTLPGEWRSADWPIPETSSDTLLYPSPRGELALVPPAAGSQNLQYRPEAGTAAGYWWGEQTGDMGSADRDGLIYDSAPLDQDLEIVGFPRLRVQVVPGAPALHWVARLESVHGDGSVSLVTGAALNGAQRRSRSRPQPLVPGKTEDLDWPLHFTTWRFHRGDRVRLVVSNGLFPMLWPTPFPAQSRVLLSSATALTLPRLPPSLHPRVELPAPEPRERRPDVRPIYEEDFPQHYRLLTDTGTGVVTVEAQAGSRFEIGGVQYTSSERTRHFVDPRDPAHAGFVGTAGDVIERKGRRLELRTRLEVTSDEKDFRLHYRRELSENGRLMRRSEATERIARDLQ